MAGKEDEEMMASVESSQAKQLQIRLKTTSEHYSVPDTVLSIPGSIDPKGLNNLVLGLLDEDGSLIADRGVGGLKFDFILFDEFLRGNLDDFLSGRDDVNREGVFEIRYIESASAPEPAANANHDDWVAGVAACGDYILTACYDNTVNIFTAQGEKKLVIPGHAGPAKAVAWISLNGEVGTFASASHDQTLMLYQWNISSNSVEAVNACRGHERSVDAVAADPAGKFVASGSYDTQLKIWSAKLETDGAEENGEAQENGNAAGGEGKRRKTSSRALTRTPIMTLAGHKEGISGVAWTDKNEICTASWDHTLKMWDIDIGGMKSEMVGSKSFFDVSYCPLNGTLVTASADRAVRLYDPRSKEGSVVKAAYFSHTGWITAVDWCKGKDTHFISGSHDMVVKMWDWRSFKTPLFDLSGHSDRILCCDWSQPELVVSGATDNNLKVYKSHI